jgi:3-oxoacyl-[acyl-carrier-protein] synthase III
MTSLTQSRIYSKLIGTGSILPGSPVSNAALAEHLATQGVETSDSWIVERTGIRQRHLADPGVTSSQLGLEAARRALKAAQLNATDVDLIIVATSTPDFIFPSTACLIQKELGCPGAAAFDVQAVCAGFTYAVSVADAMIQVGNARCALVIGAEVFSRILDWQDRGTCVLFGDGAGAIVLHADNRPGVLATGLHADGRYSDILCTAGSVIQGQVTGHPFLTMDGPAVFKLAVGVLDAVSREVCAKAGVALETVDWLIPHQANVRIMQATGKRLGIAADHVVSTVGIHANTSAASIPLALDDAIQQGHIKTGQRILLAGVGGGFAWGAALIDF